MSSLLPITFPPNLEMYYIAQILSIMIGNNIIPPQLLQRTTKVMLVPNLNLSRLLSQYAETMIPTYEIMQTPLSCCGILLYVKERLAIDYSLLQRSLRFSYGQHYIKWDSPTIWNPVPLVQGSTRWYVLVRASTYLNRYKAVRETSKWYIPVRTNIEIVYVSTYQYIPVCTDLYLNGTMWYKEVHGGTAWYIAVQSTVHGGT